MSTTIRSTRTPKRATNHIFFPSPLPTTDPVASTSSAPPASTFAYGWKDGSAVVVAGALDARDWDAACRRVDAAVASFPVVGSRLEVLGQLWGTQESRKHGKATQDSSTIKGDPRRLNVYLSSDSVPTLGDLSFTVVMYTPPSRSHLQFFSLVPLQLDLNLFSSPGQQIASKGTSSAEDTEAQILGDKVRQSAKLDFTSPSQRQLVSGTDLEQIVDWINLGPCFTCVISPTAPSRRPSLLQLISYLPLSNLLRYPLRALGFTSRALIYFANWRIPGLGTAPKDISSTAQQIDTRLSQGLSWPSQWQLIRQTINMNLHTSGRPSLPAGRAHYIQFYNTLWLIANDIIVGGAFASFFCENSEYIGTALGNLLQKYSLTSLRELLLWLNDWPGGVKLNFELASVFCDSFLWATGLWEDLIFTPIRPHLPMLVYVIGLSGLLGTTMFISATSDLLALLTVHVFVFYFLMTSLFRWHLSMLYALFNIFRGKKYNVLRHRVEPASYSVDQLLLGTILFTLAAFLFPTVLAYYLTFAAARLAIVAVHAALETVLAFMNHFPLFAVMLRLKDSARLPGGLMFDVVEGGGEGKTYLRMSSPTLAPTRVPLFSAVSFRPALHRSRDFSYSQGEVAHLQVPVDFRSSSATIQGPTAIVDPGSTTIDSNGPTFQPPTSQIPTGVVSVSSARSATGQPPPRVQDPTPGVTMATPRGVSSATHPGPTAIVGGGVAGAGGGPAGSKPTTYTLEGVTYTLNGGGGGKVSPTVANTIEGGSAATVGAGSAVIGTPNSVAGLKSGNFAIWLVSGLVTTSFLAL
ncbi:phosphatidylinositol N-acetylglucosaminyltransferase subunit Q, partial [Phenoliferia sp. Uapishka_3]